MRLNNRPWPTPRESWVMVQEWHNLLFAHWPVDFGTLRALVPNQLPLDTYDGSAWIGITPFTLKGLRGRGMPAVPPLSEFPEINVRTYVTLGDKPGIFFFSLDAASWMAVVGARLSYALPYYRSRATVREVEGWIDYHSRRVDPRGKSAELDTRYRPIGEVFNADPGTLEYFLAERYCLYAIGPLGKVWRAEIDHKPWPLQVAEAEFTTNTMAAAADIQLPAEPTLLHFSRYLDVKIWRPMRVKREEFLIRTSTSATPQS